MGESEKQERKNREKKEKEKGEIRKKVRNKSKQYFIYKIVHFFSLSNHSCAGNTSRTSYGTTCVVRAIQTINPNEKVKKA